jgi:hypothetical protein
MLEPDVTLTDYALVIECAAFAIILSSRRRAGIGSRITAYFATLFAALSAASALGGTYHGFFSETQSALGDAVWLGTLLSIGAVSFFTWLAAAQIQLSPAGQRVVFWIAVLQFVGYAIYVTTVSRDFLIASLNTVPSMLFLLVGYVRVLGLGVSAQVRMGLIGLLVAFAGAVLQQMKIGLHPEYFNHNAVYHVVQFTAFALIFASIHGLEKSNN